MAAATARRTRGRVEHDRLRRALRMPSFTWAGRSVSAVFYTGAGCDDRRECRSGPYHITWTFDRMTFRLGMVPRLKLLCRYSACHLKWLSDR